MLVSIDLLFYFVHVSECVCLSHSTYKQQLAIVHMSDQYTRISCGGTPLPRDAPVVGLLFGVVTADRMEILDANDIPIDLSDQTKMQISLHQAVFAHHVVVGWYRVSNDPEPTAEDVQTTLQLQTYLGTSQLFCSCKSQVQTNNHHPNNHYQHSEHDNGNENVDSIVTLYEEEGGILVGLEGWKLETSPAEQIAVECVIREQPTTLSSAFCTQIDTLTDSIHKMKDRIQLLLSFLEHTQEGTIPRHFGLIRQVQGLICQLGCLMGTTPQHQVPQLMQHMAVVTTTVVTVQDYMDKCQQMQESKVVSRERRF